MIFSGSGCWSDNVALSKRLKAEAITYEWEHNKKLSIHALSRLVAFVLYNNRFSPFFSFCLICGIDHAGMEEIKSLYKFI